MKVLIDVKDNKADFLLELLNNFSFVKAEKISPEKAQFFKELTLKASVEEVMPAKKRKAKSAKLHLHRQSWS